MHKVRILLVLGVWIAILPYLGFPYTWKGILTTLSGLGLICMSFMIYKESKSRMKKTRRVSRKTFDNFSENKFEAIEAKEMRVEEEIPVVSEVAEIIEETNLAN